MFQAVSKLFSTSLFKRQSSSVSSQPIPVVSAEFETVEDMRHKKLFAATPIPNISNSSIRHQVKTSQESNSKPKEIFTEPSTAKTDVVSQNIVSDTASLKKQLRWTLNSPSFKRLIELHNSGLLTADEVLQFSNQLNSNNMRAIDTIHSGTDSEVSSLAQSFLSGNVAIDSLEGMRSHSNPSRPISYSNSSRPISLIRPIITTTPPIPHQKKVAFTTVSYRYYSYTCGESVPSQNGPSIGLSWDRNPDNDITVQIDSNGENDGNYECLKFNSQERREILKLSGAKNYDIDYSEMQTKFMIMSRYRNARCESGGMMVAAVSKMDEILALEAEETEKLEKRMDFVRPFAVVWMKKTFKGRKFNLYYVSA